MKTKNILELLGVAILVIVFFTTAFLSKLYVDDPVFEKVIVFLGIFGSCLLILRYLLDKNFVKTASRLLKSIHAFVWGITIILFNIWTTSLLGLSQGGFISNYIISLILVLFLGIHEISLTKGFNSSSKEASIKLRYIFSMDLIWGVEAWYFLSFWNISSLKLSEDWVKFLKGISIVSIIFTIYYVVKLYQFAMHQKLPLTNIKSNKE